MYYFISYMLFYVFNTPFRYKQSLIPHFAIEVKDGLFWITIVMSSQLICDVMLTRGAGIVTSHSPTVFARANLVQRLSSLVNYNPEYNFSPPIIHGLVCKEHTIYTWYTQDTHMIITQDAHINRMLRQDTYTWYTGRTHTHDSCC